MAETDDDRRERARLLEGMTSLTVAFETRAIPTILEPLMTTDLTIQQIRVLMVLAATEDGATGRGLSETFGVSMPSMSGLLDRLVAQGVAVRSGDPDDSRVRRIHTTPLGRAVVRRLVTPRPEYNGDVLSRLRLDDLRALEQGMRAVHAELGWLSDSDEAATPARNHAIHEGLM